MMSGLIIITLHHSLPVFNKCFGHTLVLAITNEQNFIKVGVNLQFYTF